MIDWSAPALAGGNFINHGAPSVPPWVRRLGHHANTMIHDAKFDKLSFIQFYNNLVRDAIANEPARRQLQSAAAWETTIASGASKDAKLYAWSSLIAYQRRQRLSRAHGRLLLWLLH